MPFTENFNYCMDRRGYSAYRFSKIFGANNQSVLNWQRGVTIPHYNTRLKIAEHFGISLAELDGDVLPILPAETPPAPEIKKDITVSGDVLSPLEAELMRYVRGLSEEQKRFLLAQMQLLKQQESPSADS